MNIRTIAKVVPTILAAIGMAFFFNNCSGLTPEETQNASSGTNCEMAPSNLRSPSTIDQTTALINALPKPLSLPCFLKNLSTPLKVSSLQSTFSAQPSESMETPRVFIINGNFILSVVPTGVGKDLLEMSQYINSTESVKAELEFPIMETLSASAPYDEVRLPGSNSTRCVGCHNSERQVTGFPATAFASGIVRPDIFRTIPASQLRQVAARCNQSADPYRCAIMRAIFISGQAQDANFP